ncbi:hypothetical protein Sste5346_009980 [Sporothrix stenoceras]|uniref:Uncharacterized protein n=1 Tax=Sporothrix stenoceras TaxID=5173 RepID=A0ABR3YIM0_9PEZI
MTKKKKKFKSKSKSKKGKSTVEDDEDTAVEGEETPSQQQDKQQHGEHQNAVTLVPKYSFMAKRPPSGHSYYETYNRRNVMPVDISGEGGGVDGYDKGVLWGATAKSSRSRSSWLPPASMPAQALWPLLTSVAPKASPSKTPGAPLGKDSLQTFSGVLTPGFPNLFMVCGPHVPFGNMPIVIEDAVQWIGQCLGYMTKEGANKVDAKKEVAAAYMAELHGICDATLFGAAAKVQGAWFADGNIPGKAGQALFYFGGLTGWRRWLDGETKDNAWKSLAFEKV